MATASPFTVTRRASIKRLMRVFNCTYNEAAQAYSALAQIRKQAQLSGGAA